MINASVTRNTGENSLGVLRRFTRKVQGSGIIPRVRSLRFSTRIQSHYKIKQKTLKTLNRRKEMETLIKLGKIAPKTEHKK
jgi:ribosomal protein S21